MVEKSGRRGFGFHLQQVVLSFTLIFLCLIISMLQLKMQNSSFAPCFPWPHHCLMANTMPIASILTQSGTLSVSLVFRKLRFTVFAEEDFLSVIRSSADEARPNLCCAATVPALICFSTLLGLFFVAATGSIAVMFVSDCSVVAIGFTGGGLGAFFVRTRGSATDSCASGWKGVVRDSPLAPPSFPAALEASEKSLPCDGDLVSGGVTGSDLGTVAADAVVDI